MRWPPLDYAADHRTWEALHLWTQVVGKVRLALTPWVNHSWHVPLYVSARGLTTGLMHHPADALDLEFDLHAHRLLLRAAGGADDSIPLRTGSVAGFYRDALDMLDRNGVATSIDGAPNELPEAAPFVEDKAERPYDADAAQRLWRALVLAERVFYRFRSGFIGKVSPVHFFWGSFDLAVTRFSGRQAPPHPGGVPNLPDDVTREAYSHEVSSAGFWPGGPQAPYPLFYSYAYPQPAGFATAAVPPEARFDEGLGEFVLPYEAVRTAGDPDALLIRFLEATYTAAADAAGWNRAALECALGEPGVPRWVPGDR